MKTKSSSDWMNVTLHGRQGYAKDVGKYRTVAGKLAYKRFWLGSELEPARFAAFTICKAWAAIRASGRDLWEQQDIDGVKMMVEGPANLMKQALQGVAERQEQVRVQQEQIDRHQQSISELSFMVTGATVSTETGSSFCATISTNLPRHHKHALAALPAHSR